LHSSNHYILIFPNPFPFGGASTQRVLHLALAIKHSGGSSEILISRGTETRTRNLNFESFGTFSEVPFAYATRITQWPNGKIMKFINLTEGILGALRYVYNKRNITKARISYA